MRSAFTEPAGAMPVAPESPPDESWIRQLRVRLSAGERDADVPVEDSLAAFVPEDPGPPSRAAKHRRVTAQWAWLWGRVTTTGVSSAAVLLVAIACGVLLIPWLESREAAVQPSTGLLTITSEPVGASVYVDGARHGVTPSTLSMPIGEHRIEIGDGDARRGRTVRLTNGGEVLVHIELPPDVPKVSARRVAVTGELQISTDPKGAQVSVDGEPRGVAPVSVPNLSPGAHTVTVSGPRGVATQQVIVQRGTVSSLVISMTGSAEFASGWLAISSPIPLQIREGANLLGSTATPRVLVSAGRHDLELSNAALRYRVRRTVQVTPGRTTSLKLEVPNGTVHINALPWAEVWTGTRALGETPIANVSLPLGSHDLLFRHPELGEQRRTVVVGAKGPVLVGVDLRKGSQ